MTPHQTILNWLDEKEALAQKATEGKWRAYWSDPEKGETVAGIVTEQGQSVFRCPRYTQKDQWEKDSSAVLDSRLTTPKALAALRLAVEALKPLTQKGYDDGETAKEALSKIQTLIES